MKKLSVLFTVFLGVSVLTASAPKNNSNDSVDWAKAELNYIANLKSDNTGVITSAVGFVRKYQLVGAVEKLKTLLSSDNAENVKMSAALTLIRVGGSEGRTAVESALQEEESEIVTEFYKSLLNSHSTVVR